MKQAQTSVIGYKQFDAPIELVEFISFETRHKMKARMIMRVHQALSREMERYQTSNSISKSVNMIDKPEWVN
jgi:hypothetical protein